MGVLELVWASVAKVVVVTDGSDDPGGGEGETGSCQTDSDADIGAGDAELLHAGGVIGEGDAQIVISKAMDGAILVFTEINGSSRSKILLILSGFSLKNPVRRGIGRKGKGENWRVCGPVRKGGRPLVDIWWGRKRPGSA